MPASEERLTTALAISPAFASDRSLFAAVKGGILRSSDAGESWFTSGFPAPPPVFSSLLVSPDYERDGIILAATLEDGIVSSSDRGRHWQPWNFGLFDLAVLCLALSPHWRADETVFAGTGSGLYRSGNGGRAWRYTGYPSELAPVLSLAALRDDDGLRLLAGSESHGLLMSCDHGESWQRLAADSMRGAVNQLHAQPHADGRTTVYALADEGIWRSDDLGGGWRLEHSIRGSATAMLVMDDALLLGIHGRGILRLPQASMTEGEGAI